MLRTIRVYLYLYVGQWKAEESYHLAGCSFMAIYIYIYMYVLASTLPSMHAKTTELHRLIDSISALAFLACRKWNWLLLFSSSTDWLAGCEYRRF